MKNPYLAAILSFLFPGLGQVYGGKFDRGLIIMVVTVALSLLYGILVFIIALVTQTSILNWMFKISPMLRLGSEEEIF